MTEPSVPVEPTVPAVPRECDLVSGAREVVEPARSAWNRLLQLEATEQTRFAGPWPTSRPREIGRPKEGMTQ